MPVLPLQPTPSAGRRLVFPDLGTQDAARRVEQAIEAENRAAARVSARAFEHDARRLLAQRVAEQLEGGRAAVLRPDRRRRLLDLATTLDLRPFEANLVIAIVQDAARHGQTPTTPTTRTLLDMVPEPAARQIRHRDALRWKREVAHVVLSAILLAGLIASALAVWVTS